STLQPLRGRMKIQERGEHVERKLWLQLSAGRTQHQQLHQLLQQCADLTVHSSSGQDLHRTNSTELSVAPSCEKAGLVWFYKGPDVTSKMLWASIDVYLLKCCVLLSL
ncbi:hypothetical protein XENORESO_021462, partial [Xenotaenia resolanae]